MSHVRPWRPTTAVTSHCDTHMLEDHVIKHAKFLLGLGRRPCVRPLLTLSAGAPREPSPLDGFRHDLSLALGVAPALIELTAYEDEATGTTLHAAVQLPVLSNVGAAVASLENMALAVGTRLMAALRNHYASPTSDVPYTFDAQGGGGGTSPTPTATVLTDEGRVVVTCALQLSQYRLLITATAPTPPSLRAGAGLPDLSSAGGAAGDVTFDLAQYMTSVGTGALAWTLRGPAPPGVSIDRSSGVLTVARGRLLDAELVTVVATNGVGASASSTAAVTVAVPSVSAVGAAAPATLVDDAAYYALAPLFLDALGGGLAYAVTADPHASASVAGGLLTIQGAHRGLAYAVVVTATDANGAAATQAFEVTEPFEPAALAIPDQVVSTTAEGAFALDLSQFQTAHGTGAVTWALGPAAAPAGLELDARSGQLTVPAASVLSAAPVQVSATNASGQTSSATFRLTSTPCTVVALGPPRSASIGDGQATFALAPLFFDGLGQGLAYAVTSDPRGSASISGPDLVVQGASRGAAYTVVVTATDGAGATARQAVGVTEAYVQPRLSAIPDQIGETTASRDYTLQLAGFQTAAGVGALAWTLGQPPATVTIDRATGLLTVAHAALLIAQALTVTATNPSGGSATAAFRLTVALPHVSAAGTMPAAALPLGDGSQAAAYDLGLFFSNAFGGALSYSLSANPLGSASLSSSLAPATLTVRGAFRGTGYSVGVTATDANGHSATQTFGVVEAFAPPALSPIPPKSGSTTSTAALVVALAGYQTAGGTGTLRWSLAAPAPGGVTIGAATGLLTVACGRQLTDTPVTAVVTNQSGQAASAAFALTATVPRVAPRAAMAPASTGAGDVTYALASYFDDPYGGGLAFATSSNPHGNATISALGALAIAGAFRGTQYTVAVTATDANGYAATQAVEVTESFVPPALSPIPAKTGATTAAAALAIPLAAYQTASGVGALRWSLVSPPAGVSIDAASGTVTVASGRVYAARGVAVSVANQSGQAAQASFPLTTTVPRVAPAPGGALAPAALGDGAATYPLAGCFADAYGGGLTYAVTADPKASASVTQAPGAPGPSLTVQGASRGTTYVVAVTATDANGYAATQTLSVAEAYPPPALAAVPDQAGSTTALRTLAIALAGYQTAGGIGTPTWSLAPPVPPGVSISPSTGVVTVASGQSLLLAPVTAVVANPSGLTAQATFRLTAAVPQVAPRGAMAAATVAAGSATYALAGYFADAYLGGLTYAVSENPMGSASVASGVLTVQGASRGATYVVAVTATDANGATAAQMVGVVEAYRTPALAPIPAQVGSTTATGAFSAALAPFQTASGVGALTWTLTLPPTGVSVDAATGVLTVAGGRLFSARAITVQVANPSGQSASATFALTTTVPKVAARGSPQPATVGGGAATYDMSGFFSDPFGGGLRYSLPLNPANSATITTAGGALTVQGAFRSSSYELTVGAVDANGNVATQTVGVTELFPPPALAPVPDLAVTTTAATTSTTPLAGYQTAAGVGQAAWSLAPPVPPGVSIAGASGVLAVASGTQVVAAPLTVVVANQSGQTARATFALTATVPRVAALGTPPAAGLTANSAVYSLPSHFSDPFGSGLTFALASGGDPEGNVTLSAQAQTMAVQGANRGMSYGVAVVATDANGFSATQTFAVSEAFWPPVFAAVPAQEGSTTVSAPFAVPLAPFQTASGVGTLVWTLLPPAPAGVSLVRETGDLVVATGTHMPATQVAFAAANPSGQSAQGSLSLTMTVPRISAGAAMPAATVGDGALVLSLAGHFADPFGGGLRYMLSANPRQSAVVASAAGTLTVRGAFRGATYTVAVLANDINGFGATQSVAITELFAPPVLSPVPPVACSTTSSVPFALQLAGYQTALGVGTLAWSLAPGAPAGLSVDAATGLLRVASGTQLQAAAATVVVVNQSGQAASGALAVTAAVPRVAAAPGAPALAPAGLAATAAVYAMAGQFVDPYGGGLTYSVAADAGGGASVDASTGALLIVGANRGMTYVVEVSATDANGYAAAKGVEVTEAFWPPALSPMPDVECVTTASSAFLLPLAAYQTAGGVGTLAWSLNPPVPAGASIDAASGVLSVAGGTRLAGARVAVVAVNPSGQYATAAFALTATVV